MNTADPSVLRTDSALGVPGLLGAARAGNVAIANALGSGVLETPALPGFLPMICQTLFGEPLDLPSIATWWCGEAPALEHAIKHLPELVIKPAFPSMKLEPTFGHGLTALDARRWLRGCARRPMPLWLRNGCAFPRRPPGRATRERFEPRVVGLRLYAVATATGYDVMPGGLARVSPETGTEVISMQRGGSSKDIWVLDGAATVYESLLQPRLTARDIVRAGFTLPRVPWRIFSGWDATPSASNRLGGCCGPRRYGCRKRPDNFGGSRGAHRPVRKRAAWRNRSGGRAAIFDQEESKKL